MLKKKEKKIIRREIYEKNKKRIIRREIYEKKERKEGKSERATAPHT